MTKALFTSKNTILCFLFFITEKLLLDNVVYHLCNKSSKSSPNANIMKRIVIMIQKYRNWGSVNNRVKKSGLNADRIKSPIIIRAAKYSASLFLLFLLFDSKLLNDLDISNNLLLLNLGKSLKNYPKFN